MKEEKKKSRWTREHFNRPIFGKKREKPSLKRKIFHCTSITLIGLSTLFLAFKAGYIWNRDRLLNPEIKAQVENVAVEMNRCLPQVFDMDYVGPRIEVSYKDFLLAHSKNYLRVNENIGFWPFMGEARQAMYDTKNAEVLFYPHYQKLDITGEIDLMKSIAEYYITKKLNLSENPETDNEKALDAFKHGLAYHTVFALLPQNNKFVEEAKQELEERLGKGDKRDLDSISDREAYGYHQVDKILIELEKRKFSNFYRAAQLMLDRPPSYVDLIDTSRYAMKIDIMDLIKKQMGK